MVLTIWDVEHGACTTILNSGLTGAAQRLAMIDCGHSSTWRPSQYVSKTLRLHRIDYLFVSNADQDHISDLANLRRLGIQIKTLHRNPRPNANELRQIKEKSGPITDDMETLLNMHQSYRRPVEEPFDKHMGGITRRCFFNSHKTFSDTNNLSLVTFIKFGPFKILFPGDLEESGWLSLLDQAAFRQELRGTTILVASHHGRDSGYCREIFESFRPHAVVMSDKAIAHDTQKTAQKYREITYGNGIYVPGDRRPRAVLTTRNDGHITFIVNANGSFNVQTGTTSRRWI